MQKGAVLRLTITSVVVCLLWNFPNFSHRLAILTFLPFFLDMLDCYWAKRLFPGQINCSTLEYQRTDKVLDWMTYVGFYVLLLQYYPNTWQTVLAILIVWRYIGVVGFVYTGNTTYLKIFVDGINSSMVIMYAATRIPWVRKNIWACLCLGIISKIAFEAWHHRLSKYEETKD